MKAAHLLCSFLDQHGYEGKIFEEPDGSYLLCLREYDDVIEIRSNLEVRVYCDWVTFIELKPQLTVSLFHPRSLHLIAKYLRCIPKREKRNDLL